MNKIVLTVITVLFFISMIFLTLFSKRIHNSMIPNVTVEKLTKEMFSISVTTQDTADIKTQRRALAISKDIINNSPVFIIEEKEVNGERRAFAKEILIEINTDYENKDYFAVLKGVGSSDFVILSYNKHIKNGCEVFIDKNIV